VKSILVVVHQETSNPGLVGQVLRDYGYRLDVCCPAAGQFLPEIDRYDGAIVFGGPMSANDDLSLEFIRQELNWIPTVLAAGKPYLGICLGAQLLARVLGATVAPHPDDRREIGYRQIQPVPGHHNPLSTLTHVYHWHREGFTLPHGAELLATGSLFPHQAFRYGETAYGLQFHPEMTAEMIDYWTTQASEQMLLPDAQPYEQQLQHHISHAEAVERWLRGFLQTWLNSAPEQGKLAPGETHGVFTRRGSPLPPLEERGEPTQTWLEVPLVKGDLGGSN
jgi:GMP synthase (glutamine-hydrolysing)